MSKIPNAVIIDLEHTGLSTQASGGKIRDNNLFTNYALYIEKTSLEDLHRLAKLYQAELGRRVHITVMVRKAIKQYIDEEFRRLGVDG